MRIDVVSIFPEYLAPLELSLIGKARQDGLLDLRVHDLRSFTTDRHRTVDDTPYGGGAGMVMKPEPWAQALESVADARPEGAGKPVLIVPSPAGERFTQASSCSMSFARFASSTAWRAVRSAFASRYSVYAPGKAVSSARLTSIMRVTTRSRK